MQSQKLDIVELIEHNPITKLSKDYQGKFIEKVKKNFSETQQQLYIASLYTFLNYNSKTDFVIELERIWKWLGFSRKEHCKIVLEKHFILDTDYKIGFPEVAGKLKNGINVGGRPKEKILMTINTFKKLCLKSNTEKADEIHDYYIKLEEITQETLMEESEELKLQLNEQKELVKELENKPETEGFDRKHGYVYFIEDTTKKGHKKIGFADRPDKRLGQLNTGSSTYSLKIIKRFETYDKEFAEKMIHFALNPFRIKNRKEWFYIKDDIELAYVIKTIESCINYIKQYDIKNYKEFKNENKNLKLELKELDTEETIQKENKEKISKICKTNAQQFKAKTGNFKGVYWKEDKNKWTANLKRNYKNIFLGYYDLEIEGAKAYNDYAMYLNNTFEDCNYLLNEIANYTNTPRNIPEEKHIKEELKKKELINKKASKDNEENIYTGVQYDSKRKIYKAAIKFNNKSLYLGCSENMIEVAKLYNQQASYLNNHKNTNYILNEIPNYITIEKDIYTELQDNKKENTSSKYYGVSFNKLTNKWRAIYVIDKKQTQIGSFTTELEAAKAYNKIVIKLNKDELKKIKYKVNTFEEEI